MVTLTDQYDIIIPSGNRLLSFPFMTTFLTTAQREFLFNEYKQQLIDMEELEDNSDLLEELKTMDNVAFWTEICDFMPGYAEPGRLAKEMAK